MYPGEYEETVNAHEKTINIIGVNKEKCILKYPNGDYAMPPLEMGSGQLINMTIYAVGEEKKETAVAKAYAMHIDYDISKDNMLYIKNVDFINDDYQVVGIGLRNGFTLKFENCRFVCNGDENAFYCHDDPVGEASTNQKLIVKDCYFENSGEEASILLQSQEAQNSEIKCMWVNNTVVNRKTANYLNVVYWNSKVSDEKGWLNMSFWENSFFSKGNNILLLNK